MFFWALAIWTAITLAVLTWIGRKMHEASRGGMIVIHVVELAACFAGLIVLWKTGWGGAVTDTAFAGTLTLLLVGAGVVYMVIRDGD